jgi:hypothetical protein
MHCVDFVDSAFSYGYFCHQGSSGPTGEPGSSEEGASSQLATFCRQLSVRSSTQIMVLNWTQIMVLNWTQIMVLNCTQIMVLNWTQIMVLNWTQIMVLNCTQMYL